MYILYVLLFMASMIAMIDWRADARKDSDGARADAVATQMASFHQQVMSYCQDAVCPAGAVQPAQNLPWHMRDAGIYGISIRSVYDGTGLFVTYYTAPGTPIEQGRIADALVTKLHGAANAGRYNSSLGQVLRSVFRTGPVSALEQMSLTVPATVGGATFTDGMPMVATRLKGQAAAADPDDCPFPGRPPGNCID